MRPAFKQFDVEIHDLVCTADGCDVHTLTMVVDADDDDYWDGSAVCGDERHAAEVVAEFEPRQRSEEFR